MPWTPYTPSPDQPWDTRRAAHLLRRAGFGTPPDALRAALATNPQAAVDQLFTPLPAAAIRERSQMARLAARGKQARQLAAFWLYQLAHTPAPLHEKMTLFWHGHFATSAAKVPEPDLLLQQHDLLHTHALGNFRDLLLGITRDPAMLLYLDAANNRKARPNENLARELMELFTLGEGHYAENDIRELARALTGWEVHFKRATFRPHHHDPGPKTLLGRTAPFTDTSAVDHLLQQAACPRFLVRKLLRAFVADELPLPDELVAPLARQFQANYEIKPLLRTILGSRFFFSDPVIGARISSPTEFTIGFLRTHQATTNFEALARTTAQLGQDLFHPPSVKGWDGGRAWLHASAFIGRVNFITRLARQKQFPGPLLPLEELLPTLPVPLPARSRRALASAERKDPKSTLPLLAALPEYHLA